jgi:hypothetical protein
VGCSFVLSIEALSLTTPRKTLSSNGIVDIGVKGFRSAEASDEVVVAVAEMGLGGTLLVPTRGISLISVLLEKDTF